MAGHISYHYIPVHVCHKPGSPLHPFLESCSFLGECIVPAMEQFPSLLPPRAPGQQPSNYLCLSLRLPSLWTWHSEFHSQLFVGLSPPGWRSVSIHLVFEHKAVSFGSEPPRNQEEKKRGWSFSSPGRSSWISTFQFAFEKYRAANVPTGPPPITTTFLFNGGAAVLLSAAIIFSPSSEPNIYSYMLEL